MNHTTTLTLNDPIWHHYLSNGNNSVDDKNLKHSPKQSREITIWINGNAETLLLIPFSPVYIGRLHPTNKTRLDLDLSDYEASKHGVSRIHACLELNHYDHLYITDLNSKNGTKLAGKRLRFFDPKLVHNGDEVRLGNLRMTINFKPRIANVKR